MIEKFLNADPSEFRVTTEWGGLGGDVTLFQKFEFPSDDEFVDACNKVEKVIIL